VFIYSSPQYLIKVAFIAFIPLQARCKSLHGLVVLGLFVNRMGKAMSLMQQGIQTATKSTRKTNGNREIQSAIPNAVR
jgi:hypothetical protein